jgi:hypothetical protein
MEKNVTKKTTTKENVTKEYVVGTLCKLEKLDETQVRKTPGGTYVDVFVDDHTYLSFVVVGVRNNEKIWKLISVNNIDNIMTITAM